MKYHRNFFSHFKIYITGPICGTSLFSTHMTMIPHLIISNIKQFITNPTNITQLKSFFFLCWHDKVFVKTFFYHSATIIVLTKECFNKFVNIILSSAQDIFFTEFIVNTNNFISKTARNMILKFSFV